MKRCTHKDHEGSNPLPLTEFGKDRNRKDGLHSQCKACRFRTKQIWYEMNREKVSFQSKQRYRTNHEENKRLGNIRSKEYKKQRGLSWSLLQSVKARAKKRGLAFDLVETDIVIPEKCPVLGLTLQQEVGERGPNYPTVDRIDSTKGYTKDNIIVISWRANCIKRDATLQELELLGLFAQQVREKANGRRRKAD